MLNHDGVNDKGGSIMQRSSEEHAAALGARFGFFTFPVELGGKKPLVKSWEQKATTDGSLFRASPGANIGIALGRSGHLVVDVDGPDGQGAARELFGGEIPTTLTATTGRADGGRHYYFKLPDGAHVRGRSGVGPGLDLKAAGGFVVAPPSLHGSGRRYTFESPDVPIATLSAWQVEALNAISRPSVEALSPEELERRCAPGEGAERIEYVRELLEAIPNDAGFDAREDWIAMAHSIKVACGEEYEHDAFDLFDAWSKGWAGRGEKKYDPAETRRVFESLGPSRARGFQDLLSRAEANGYEPSAALVTALYEKRLEEAHEEFGPIPGAEPPSLAEDPFTDTGTSPPSPKTWLEGAAFVRAQLRRAKGLIPNLPAEQRPVAEAALVHELQRIVGRQVANTLVRQTLHPEDRDPFGDDGQLQTLDLARLDVTASYLIPDLIPAAAVGMLVAPHSLGKSFLAVDLALSIAFGTRWLGTLPTQNGSALFVVAEGQAAFPLRLAAWLITNDRLPEDFTRRQLDEALSERAAVTRYPLRLDDPRMVEGLIRTIRARDAKIVIMDTLGRLLGSEQSDDHNDTANAVMRDLHEVAIATGATILLIHHTGHENRERARGASAWEQAADFVYVLKGNADDFGAGLPVDLVNKKMKDGERAAKSALVKHQVSMRLDGETHWSAVLDQTRPITPTPDHVTLFELIEENPGIGVRALREEAPLGSKKVTAARNELFDLGAIENKGIGTAHAYFVVPGWSIAFDHESLVPSGGDSGPAPEAPDMSLFRTNEEEATDA
jgi:hypothetical protein